MKLYRIDVGATYWVVAKNFFQAFEVARRSWEMEGVLEDVVTGEGINIEKVPESHAMTWHPEEGEPARSIWIDVQKCVEPQVLACSEW